MTNNGIVKIHGQDYMTVAGRLEEARKNGELLEIDTQVLQYSPVVVIKATVTTKKGKFTGISASNPSKTIEKQSPYETSETSAVGRALGFAGFGVIEGIATADEVAKATNETTEDSDPDWIKDEVKADEHYCHIHNKPLKERTNKDGGSYWDHRWQENNQWQRCYGKEQSNV